MATVLPQTCELSLHHYILVITTFVHQVSKLQQAPPQISTHPDSKKSQQEPILE